MSHGWRREREWKRSQRNLFRMHRCTNSSDWWVLMVRIIKTKIVERKGPIHSMCVTVCNASSRKLYPVESTRRSSVRLLCRLAGWLVVKLRTSIAHNIQFDFFSFPLDFHSMHNNIAASRRCVEYFARRFSFVRSETIHWNLYCPNNQYIPGNIHLLFCA